MGIEGASRLPYPNPFYTIPTIAVVSYIFREVCMNKTAEKWSQSEICIVINDKSHGSIAKHSRCDELLY